MLFLWGNKALTFTTLWANSTDDRFVIFFSPENRIWHCLFSGKKKKNISLCCQLKILPRVLNFHVSYVYFISTYTWFFFYCFLFFQVELLSFLSILIYFHTSAYTYFHFCNTMCKIFHFDWNALIFLFLNKYITMWEYVCTKRNKIYKGWPWKQRPQKGKKNQRLISICVPGWGHMSEGLALKLFHMTQLRFLLQFKQAVVT